MPAQQDPLERPVYSSTTNSRPQTVYASKRRRKEALGTAQTIAWADVEILLKGSNWFAGWKGRLVFSSRQGAGYCLPYQQSNWRRMKSMVSFSGLETVVGWQGLTMRLLEGPGIGLMRK